MKCISLIAGLIAAPFCLFSQVNGIVIDKDTNQPVNIVAIAAQGRAIGTYSDERGFFSLPDFGDSDSIIFRHIGYKKTMISTIDIEDTILLHPKINNLSEVTILPSGYSEKKSKTKNSNSNISFAGFPGLEVTQLIKMDVDYDFIKSIKIFVKKTHSADSTYIRIHLYSNKNGKPGGEMVLSKGMFVISRITSFISIDIESERIQMPPEGVFIGIEWINQSTRKSQRLEPRVLLSKNKRQTQNTYYRFWDEPWESINSLLHLEKANTIIELTTIGKTIK